MGMHGSDAVTMATVPNFQPRVRRSNHLFQIGAHVIRPKQASALLERLPVKHEPRIEQRQVVSVQIQDLEHPYGCEVGL